MNEASKWALRTLLVLLVVGAFVLWPFGASCILTGAVLTAFILHQGVCFFFAENMAASTRAWPGAHGHMLLNENDAPLLPVSAPNSKAADAAMAGLDGFEPAGVSRYSGNNNGGALNDISIMIKIIIILKTAIGSCGMGDSPMCLSILETHRFVRAIHTGGTPVPLDPAITVSGLNIIVKRRPGLSGRASVWRPI